MTTIINGRTYDEIKRGLECCLVCRDYRDCLICPYGTPRKRGVLPCECEVKQDILALINQLLEDKKQLERERDEARNDLDTLNYANTELHGAYDAMKRERDAAVEEIDHICDNCKFADRPFGVEPCPTMEENNFGDTCSNWQWRGPQEVN